MHLIYRWPAAPLQPQHDVYFLVGNLVEARFLRCFPSRNLAVSLCASPSFTCSTQSQAGRPFTLVLSPSILLPIHILPVLNLRRIKWHEDIQRIIHVECSLPLQVIPPLLCCVRPWTSSSLAEQSSVDPLKMAAVLQLLLKRALDAMVTQCVTLNSCNCRADERILFNLTGCEVNVVQIFKPFHVSIYSAPVTLRFLILAMAELITYTGCHTIAKSWCGPWPHGLLSHRMMYTSLFSCIASLSCIIDETTLNQPGALLHICNQVMLLSSSGFDFCSL